MRTEPSERRITMTTIIEIEKRVETAVEPSERVLHVAAMFGLGVDEQRTLSVVPRTKIPLPAGGLVFVTGPSGGGKTTILNLIADGAAAQGMHVIRAEALPGFPGAGVPLVDAFDLPLERTCSLLAQAGLGDAFVMLRKPHELSDGQRYRLRIAQMIDSAARATAPTIMLADEFGATLDRVTAAVVARNIRRWITHTPHTFVCATTHDDLLEHLQPDVLIHKELGERIEVITRAEMQPHTQSHDGTSTDGEEHREHPRTPNIHADHD